MIITLNEHHEVVGLDGCGVVLLPPIAGASPLAIEATGQALGPRVQSYQPAEVRTEIGESMVYLEITPAPGVMARLALVPGEVPRVLLVEHHGCTLEYRGRPAAPFAVAGDYLLEMPAPGVPTLELIEGGER